MRKALFFLGILNDTDLDWMLASGSRQEVAAGQTIVREGEPVESLFLVLDGTFSVTHRGLTQQIAKLQSGEIVGEISFVDRRPPAASVTSLEKSAVLAIPRSALERKLTTDLQFASRFYCALATFLSDRLRTTVGMLGYGSGQGEALADQDEIDPDVLENLSLAGTRFEWLQRRLRAV